MGKKRAMQKSSKKDPEYQPVRMQELTTNSDPLPADSGPPLTAWHNNDPSSPQGQGHHHSDDDIGMGPVYVRQDTQSTYQKKTQKKKSFKTLKRTVTKGISDFFLGDLPAKGEDQVDNHSLPPFHRAQSMQEKWRNRSLMYHSNALIGGKVNPKVASYDTSDSVFETASQSAESSKTVPGMHIVDPLHRQGLMAARQDSKLSRTSRLSKSFNYPSRQWSHVSTASSGRRSQRPIPRRVSRRDSVVKMAYDGMKDILGYQTGSKKQSKRKPVMHSRSFAPASVSEGGFDDLDTLKSFRRGKSPAVDSVFTSDDSILDDVFFNTPTPTGTMMSPFSHPRGQAYMGGASNQEPVYPEPLPTITERSSHTSEATRSSDTTDHLTRSVREKMSLEEPVAEVTSPETPTSDASSAEIKVPVLMMAETMEHEKGSLDPISIPETRPTKSGWRVSTKIKYPPVTASPAMGPDTPDFLADMPDGPFEAMGRIKDTLIDAAMDNADRREIGKGLMGNILDLSYRKDRMTSEIEAQIDAIDEHRPYFTYWVTFVQVVIYIISVSVYGIAPIGFEETRIYGEVRMPNFAIQVESRIEKDNLWIGPRQADLIHLGAKYSPCMRKDQNVEDAITGDRRLESETACCIRNDGSGCLQTQEDKCSSSLSKWFSWKKYPQLGDDRSSGPVCGTDPRKCKNPIAQGAFGWPQDITDWPICRETANVSDTDSTYPHLTCKMSGRPCCIGIQGECIITTREHCDFMEGFFHKDAFLCSQVSCMNEICGMITFLDPDVPDQFYRLWTSLFLHAGLLQLIVSVLFQFFIMRDMEKLAGWLRIAIIYIGSGIAGSLSSAIFLPYHVEAGPAGSQFGILAMLFVEVIQNFYIIKHPWRALGKLIGILLFLFVLGLLPYIDNYAHLIGFVFGFLLSFALLPYITFNKLDRRGKIIGIVACLIIATGLFAVLIILFYVSPVYNCPYCHYFNCIPFTPKFCETMEVKIGREQ